MFPLVGVSKMCPATRLSLGQSCADEPRGDRIVSLSLLRGRSPVEQLIVAGWLHAEVVNDRGLFPVRLSAHPYGLEVEQLGESHL